MKRKYSIPEFDIVDIKYNNDILAYSDPETIIPGGGETQDPENPDDPFSNF